MVEDGDVYEFRYPDEPRFNRMLTVVEVTGSLAFFDDGSHCKLSKLRRMHKMILPTEPVRGLTFEKYLEMAWRLDEKDGDFNVLAQLACKLACREAYAMKALPNVIQVYWFERAKNLMMTALMNIKKEER
jgi:hypothetical protein